MIQLANTQLSAISDLAAAEFRIDRYDYLCTSTLIVCLVICQVIQRRDDFGDSRENFNRDWADYKNGFGDPAREFWLGNENIYMLTNNEDYMLRVELEDFEGNKR